MTKSADKKADTDKTPFHSYS